MSDPFKSPNSYFNCYKTDDDELGFFFADDPSEPEGGGGTAIIIPANEIPGLIAWLQQEFPPSGIDEE